MNDEAVQREKYNRLQPAAPGMCQDAVNESPAPNADFIGGVVRKPYTKKHECLGLEGGAGRISQAEVVI